MTFTAFQDIEGLHNVVKGLRLPFEVTNYTVTYRAKAKLHGTNAGIRIDLNTGEVKVMKRTGFITPENDNFGFAAWVESIKSEFAGLLDDSDHQSLEIWGEWVGPGVQKGVALTQLPHKVFAPFMVILEDVIGGRKKIVDPEDIATYLPERADIIPIEWEDFLFEFEFINKKANQFPISQQASVMVSLEELNQLVERADSECPWVKRHFNISGPGEGYVLYPFLISASVGKEVARILDIEYSRLMFKAKGESHKVVKNKAAVIIDPEKVAKYSDFAEKFVTEARCLQGVQAVGGLDIRNVGAFLKWLGNDVIKESEDELEVSGMEWKDVAKSVNSKASAWFKKAVLAELAA